MITEPVIVARSVSKFVAIRFQVLSWNSQASPNERRPASSSEPPCKRQPFKSGVESHGRIAARMGPRSADFYPGTSIEKPSVSQGIELRADSAEKDSDPGVLIECHAMTAASGRRDGSRPHSLPAPALIGPHVAKDFAGLGLSTEQERLPSIFQIDHGPAVPRRRCYGRLDPTPFLAVQLPGVGLQGPFGRPDDSPEQHRQFRAAVVIYLWCFVLKQDRTPGSHRSWFATAERVVLHEWMKQPWVDERSRRRVRRATSISVTKDCVRCGSRGGYGHGRSGRSKGGKQRSRLDLAGRLFRPNWRLFRGQKPLTERPRRLKATRRDTEGVESTQQPLDVLCGGMYRACSTWQYEVAAHLIEQYLGGQRLGYFTGEQYATLVRQTRRRREHVASEQPMEGRQVA